MASKTTEWCDRCGTEGDTRNWTWLPSYGSAYADRTNVASGDLCQACEHIVGELIKQALNTRARDWAKEKS